MLELLEKETLDKAQVADVFDDAAQAAGPAGLDRLVEPRPAARVR